jgi:hypothetical protein
MDFNLEYHLRENETFFGNRIADYFNEMSRHYSSQQFFSPQFTLTATKKLAISV